MRMKVAKTVHTHNLEPRRCSARVAMLVEDAVGDLQDRLRFVVRGLPEQPLRLFCCAALRRHQQTGRDIDVGTVVEVALSLFGGCATCSELRRATDRDRNLCGEDMR